LLGNFDPLFFLFGFAKLFTIMDIPESYKYCVDILKFTGFALMSPLATTLFFLLTDYHYLTNSFHYVSFAISLLSSALGLKCILRGYQLLDNYYSSEKSTL
jgi:hypothetical protein